jgi:TRAP-type C4-dicarboxylate transport system permease small subunit
MTTTTGTFTDRDERGEGVVSSAIAVLVFAALGALMWVGFKNIWGNASSQTSTQIDSIGR